MIKKAFLFALSTALIVTSCADDETLQGDNVSNQEISFHPSVTKNVTRAVEATTANLTSFKLSAFQTGRNNWMSDVLYTGSGNNWSTDKGKFFWPSSGDLNFYCYAPDAPGKEGSFTINASSQKLNGFVPNTTAATQQDFIYAKATGSLANNGTSGLDVNFQHALSEISVQAKNDNKAYTVEVSGVKLGNIVYKGDFSFPSVSGDAAAWSLSTDKAAYVTEWTTANKLSSTVSSLDAANVPFMLIPQQLTDNAKAVDGSYIALKVKITMQGGDEIYNDWAYVTLGTNWEMGKHYIYTLDFSNGVGEDAQGELIFGDEIDVDCKITSWNEKVIEIMIYQGERNANSVVVDPVHDEYYYGIDVSRANTFWSNSDVGDASNDIDNNTEWTAEVIWQDIPSRAINFCDKSGATVCGDTYSGKGLQPLYIKAASGQKGNVVVGIKKKGAGTDAYLWSWHLWLTDEPQLVSGFMDRNLGATSATPSDGSKTYGLYYQFGRKDAFVPDIDIYDINGNKLQNSATIATGKVTFAKAVQNPGTFYTYGSSEPYDWASPNNYTSKNWNDITNADGKTFFDPCPEGWRLPIKSEYSNFSTTTFTWDATNRGRTYNYNWFPAAGWRNYSNGSVDYVGSEGKCWSVSPSDESYGYYLYFYSSSVYLASGGNRATGRSVRCVQE